MNRKIKNIIMITLLLIVIGITCFTVKSAIDSKKTTSNGHSIGNNSNMGQPPSGNPPDMSNSSNMSTPPEKTSSDNNSQSSDSNIPEMPSNNSSNMKPPSNMNNNTSSKSIDTKYYVFFAIESISLALILSYLIVTTFNKKKMNKNDKFMYVVVTLLVCGITFVGCSLASQKINNKTTTNNNIPDMKNDNSSSVDAKGNKEVTSEETLKDSYSSTTSDESAILVSDGGNATIDGAKITKSGDSSNTENSEFYGINAAILVTKNSTATIKNATINTTAKGANAVFSTGTNSKIYISDSTITSTGSSSARGLDATYGGYIEANNVTITTKGGSCATLATDRGEGTVKVTDSKLVTNGSGSPVIYSTGDISITNTTGSANGSQMVVIEGKNSATVTNSKLDASAKGNRGTTDQAGIMIYQSMSGDAGEGTGTFTAKNSSLTIQKDSDYYKSAPMFFITNTKAVINLENTTLSYGSNLLISAKGTSEWGTSGSNGGELTMNTTNQELEGNIEIDKLSTLTMNLTKTTYKGTINKDNSAKSITLKLDKNSKITLTGDSYITTLDNSDSTNSNIDFNGYKLYVNGKAIN